MNNDNEFMDVDGPEFIHTVNHEIASIRSSSSYRTQKLNYTSTTHTSNRTDIDPSHYNDIAIIDTNFLLSNLGTLNALLDVSEENPGQLLVIIPWQVILELDGLKSKNIESESKVGLSARKAMKFLELQLRSKKVAIRGQRIDERLKEEMGDNAILDCCMYFQERVRRLTLLSNDRNLCIKVMVHGMESLSAESKEGLEELLNRVYRGRQPVDMQSSMGNGRAYDQQHVSQRPAAESNDMDIDGDEVYYENDDMMMDAAARGSENSKWALVEELKAPSKPRVAMKDYSSMKPINKNDNSSWASIYAPK